MKLSNAVASLVLFALLFGLILGAYNSFQDANSYNITVDANQTQMLDDLNDLGIVKNMNETFQSVYELKAGGGAVDILGALASAGIGVIKGIGNLLIFPFQIGSILDKHYNIPSILINSLLVMLLIFIGFKIISAYVQQEV